MAAEPRHRGAPHGNRNAAKAQPGLRTSGFYLNAAEVAILDALLAERGEAATDSARMRLARELLRRAIQDVGRAQETNEAIIV